MGASSQTYKPGQATASQYDSDMSVAPSSTFGGKGYSPAYNPPPAVDIPQIATNVGTGIAAGAMAAGTLTGPAGWLVMGGIQLLGGLLGAFTHRDPPRNPMELEYEDMVKFYRRVGARSQAARAVASVVTGKPASELTHIGVDDSTALDMTMNHFDTARSKTAEKVTGGTR